MSAFVYGTLMFPEVSWLRGELHGGGGQVARQRLCTRHAVGLLHTPLQVLHALIDRVPRMEPAVIQGYQRYRIRGQVGGASRAGGVAAAREQGSVASACAGHPSWPPALPYRPSTGVPGHHPGGGQLAGAGPGPV